jgi:hypothetical protein
MEQTMKKTTLRRLQDDTHAGIATYVLMMLGLAFMLYLFGFTSMYTQWSAASSINGTGDNNESALTDPNINQGGDLIENLMNPVNILVAAGAGLIGIGIISWFMGHGSTVVWQYAIPAIILIALNIFVFPINNMLDETGALNTNAFPITGFLLFLFNIFYLLAVVEFIRGPTT